MFRHFRRNRTLKDNLRIASLLSFVAGMVNVAGFLDVKQLTTNITGHFAFFIEEIYHLDLWRGWMYFLFVFFFFSGSFFSGLLTEFLVRKNKQLVLVIPVTIEALILLLVAFTGDSLLENNSSIIASILLFSMGLQNAMVTMISNSVVRTTHLTGLFTDLGIEFAQLFFFKTEQIQKKLLSSIQLRISIILFFILGGIFSGFLFGKLGIKVISIASFLLLFSLFYDQFLLRLRKYKRNKSHKKILTNK